MGVSTWVSPYEPVVSILELANGWLAHENVERSAFALDLSILAHRAGWRLSIYRTPQGVKGVSVVFPGGDWRMEADDQDSALMLANMAAMDERIPSTLMTSARTAEWLSPYLNKTGRVRNEGELVCMTCRQPLGQRGGRWATKEDLAALREFSANPTFPAANWEALIAFHELAIIDNGSKIVAAAVIAGKTAALAGLAAIGFDPLLVAFLTAELLTDRPAVQVSVPREEAERYRSLGFQPSGTLYMATFA
jgi:hypothetical protein